MQRPPGRPCVKHATLLLWCAIASSMSFYEVCDVLNVLDVRDVRDVRAMTQKQTHPPVGGCVVNGQG